MLKKRMSTIFWALMPHSLVESFFTRCKFDKGDAYQLSIRWMKLKGGFKLFRSACKYAMQHFCVFIYKHGVNLVHCESDNHIFATCTL